MIQIQFRISCPEKLPAEFVVETDLLKREDANELEIAVAKDIEEVTQRMLKMWMDQIGVEVSETIISEGSNPV